MTFILVAANADQVIQVSDRRITGDGGVVLDNAFGKAGHLLCDDASVLYSFTGLATINDFKTSTWLMDTFLAASKRSARFDELVRYFAELAAIDFRSNRDVISVRPDRRKLTVILSGYNAVGNIVCVLISNYQDFINGINHPIAQTEFTVFFEESAIPRDQNPTLLQAAGAFNALTDADEQELRLLVERRAPSHAIEDKMAAIVAEISDRHRAGGTVGKRLNIGCLYFLTPHTPHVGYVSDVVEQDLPLLDVVDARSGVPQLLVRDVQFSADHSLVFPRVHRNAPCPCGSGQKYRFCHRAPRS